MIRVFVSSVSGGLEDTRSQIIGDLNKAGYDLSAMERFGAQPTVPLDVCLKELRNSHVVAVVDSCSVRAVYAGDQTGPNPTDRAKRGSKRHLICDGQGVPLAVRLTGADRNDSQEALALVDAIPPLQGKCGRADVCVAESVSPLARAV